MRRPLKISLVSLRVLSGAGAVPVTKWSLGRREGQGSVFHGRSVRRAPASWAHSPSISQQHLINSQAGCHHGSHGLSPEAQKGWCSEAASTPGLHGLPFRENFALCGVLPSCGTVPRHNRKTTPKTLTEPCPGARRCTRPKGDKETGQVRSTWSYFLGKT